MSQEINGSKFKNHIFETDLKSIIQRCEKVFDVLKGQEILITGATGFVGTWLTHTFLMANKELGCKIEIDVVYRDGKKLNEIYGANLNNIRNRFKIDLSLQPSCFPAETNSYSLFIHAAANTNYQLNQGKSTSTENLLKLAQKQKRLPIFIYLSSGAVYGDLNVIKFPETALSSLPKVENNYKNYALEKYLSEKFIEDATLKGEIYGSCPRLFTFYGPFFPLKNQYAVSSFLIDGLNTKRIKLKGNPETTRSYLYPTDLVTAILKMILNPKMSPTHIGSDKAIKMIELASLIDQITGNSGIQIDPNGQSASHYVPEIFNSESQLGLLQTIEIEDGLERWINWISD